MELRLFKTLWGHFGDYEDAIHQASAAGFQGIEGPAPDNSVEAKRLRELLDDSKQDFIAEITTAGSYIPDRHSTLDDHLDSLTQKLERSLPIEPLFITCLGGCDAWSEAQSVDFFGRAIEIGRQNDSLISFETHRGRSFFNPWITQRIVSQLPQIRLTCDFSHWCVVCERLMDTESDVLEYLAPYAHHIHARVGYDQGPQVPHPAAPEYQIALHSHQEWWTRVWKSQLEREYKTTTMTPEFGPDGYLHEAPFTCEPVADLWQINQWMANEERRHFNDVIQGPR